MILEARKSSEYKAYKKNKREKKQAEKANSP